MGLGKGSQKQDPRCKSVSSLSGSVPRQVSICHVACPVFAGDAIGRNMRRICPKIRGTVQDAVSDVGGQCGVGEGEDDRHICTGMRGHGDQQEMSDRIQTFTN